MYVVVQMNFLYKFHSSTFLLRKRDAAVLFAFNNGKSSEME